MLHVADILAYRKRAREELVIEEQRRTGLHKWETVRASHRRGSISPESRSASTRHSVASVAAAASASTACAATPPSTPRRQYSSASDGSSCNSSCNDLPLRVRLRSPRQFLRAKWRAWNSQEGPQDAGGLTESLIDASDGLMEDSFDGDEDIESPAAIGDSTQFDRSSAGAPQVVWDQNCETACHERRGMPFLSHGMSSLAGAASQRCLPERCQGCSAAHHAGRCV